jgi:hypothetical protein
MNKSPAPTAALADAPAVPTVAEQADRLRLLDERLGLLHQVTVDVIDVLADVVGTGIVEQVEGLPVDHWLRLRARMIHADAQTLVTAADVLPQMPVTYGLFRRGVISWGTARNLAQKLARRSFADRRLVDRHIDATRDQWGAELDGWGGDQLLDAVDRAVDELDDLKDVLKREDREERTSYVAVQPSLDGRVRLFADLDPIGGATVLNGLDAATPDGSAKTRGERRAQGLVAMAADYLAGSPDRDAKPLVTVVVQLADVTATAAGHLVVSTPGVLPTLSARLVDLLAETADLQAVIVDGARPLATTKKRQAAVIPDDVRAAIVARDVTDRMPGSDRPLQHVHHMRHREHGGDHDPVNLVGLSDTSHGLIHRHGWTTHLDHMTGRFTITRDGTTWTSVPRTTPLSHPAHHM